MILVGENMGLRPGCVADAHKHLEGGAIHPMTAAAMEKEATKLNDNLRHDAALIAEANRHAEQLKTHYGFAVSCNGESVVQGDSQTHRM